MQPLRVTISALPDDVLLEIFKYYVNQIYPEDTWHTLAHVCRKWRYVVFASPRWLRLELRCTNKSPVKKMLDIWPALPIVIDAYITNSRRSGVANIIAALKRHDLVCRINIWGVPNSLLKSAAIKRRFSKLTDLTLRSNEENAPVIPDSFLSGSAPRLQSLEFRGIPFPFPALGKLLLSTTDLVTLRLLDIPNSGYISPEQIVTSLSALTRLQDLFIDFRSPRSRADRAQRHPTRLKRLVLPSLTEFYFKGDSEYLEGIVGRMETPALDMVTITFFNQLIFDNPLLRDFFSRTAVFQKPHRADVSLSKHCIDLTFFRREETVDRRMLSVGISSSVLEWQISSLAQFCSTCFPPLPTLERLVMHGLGFWTELPDDMDIAPWSELLHSFVTVKDLFLSWTLMRDALYILRRLIGEGVPAVLPALRHVFGWGESWRGYARIQEAVTEFITARQFSGHPVVFDPMETGSLS